MVRNLDAESSRDQLIAVQLAARQTAFLGRTIGRTRMAQDPTCVAATITFQQESACLYALARDLYVIEYSPDFVRLIVNRR